MASIALVTSIENSSTTATSLTVTSPSVSGTSTFGVVATQGKQNVDSITNVTWNNVPMQKVITIQCPIVDRFVTLWGLHAPTAGATNIVITSSANDYILQGSACYSGVSQSMTNENDASASDTYTGVNQATMPVTITTVADNCWIIAASQGNSQGPPTSWASPMIVRNGGGTGQLIADSNTVKTPAGAYVATANYAGNAQLHQHAIVAMSIAPDLSVPAATTLPFGIGNVQGGGGFMEV